MNKISLSSVKLCLVYILSISLVNSFFILITLTEKPHLYSTDFFLNENTYSLAYAQDIHGTKYENKTKIVYHLSSDEPWRATIALLDSQTMLQMGYNVTLMLSIEGVQLGVKNPHQYLGLQPLTNNVSTFLDKGGNVIICEICLKIAGYNNTDIIDGSIIGSPKIMANLLNQTTVVDY